MNDTSPAHAAGAALDRAIATAAFSTKRQTLAELPGHGALDPNELFRHRFLCRGSAALLVSQTGGGKSSFVVQGSINWTMGRPLFGLTPVRPLRVWMIQAENDAQDLGEMRDGVCHSMVAAGEVTQADIAAAVSQVSVFTEDSVCGERFGSYLDALLTDAGAERPDLLITDPAFAYFGGDFSNQAEVSPFLRNVLNPIIHRHNVGLILVHHTTKPQATRPGQAAPNSGDYAYLGSGSAELANWARGVLSIQQVPSIDGLYVLRAGKRGRRLGWTDSEGKPTCSRYIAHAREPGMIYWRTPGEDELPGDASPQQTGRPSKKPGDYLPAAYGMVTGKPMSARDLKAELQDRCDIGEKLAQTILTLALSRGGLAKARVITGSTSYDLVGLPGQAERERDRIQQQFRNPELSPEPAA